MNKYNNPWKIEFIDETVYSSHFDILDSTKNVIGSFIATQEQAQLIAAAPKLLGAVEQGYEMIDTLAGLSSWDGRSEDEINEVMNQMLEAIKKAKGDGENFK
jgi:phosphate/sulfate permease